MYANNNDQNKIKSVFMTDKNVDFPVNVVIVLSKHFAKSELGDEKKIIIKNNRTIGDFFVGSFILLFNTPVHTYAFYFDVLFSLCLK